MSILKAVVIQFPGSNCEYETIRALKLVGFDADLVRWNDEGERILSADVVVLPGGFSFQDRVRAGAISAKLPVLDYVKEASQKGALVMGICNGCQILVEAGLVPQTSDQMVCAMRHNHFESAPVEYMCDWVYVKVLNPDKSPFTKGIDPHAVFPVQVAHGEGCFEFAKDTDLSFLEDITQFVYCTRDGEPIGSFPVNPNGSHANLAGITNVKGNVFAFMPHPERGVFLHQIPLSMRNTWSRLKSNGNDHISFGPWYPLFERMKRNLDAQRAGELV